MSKDAQLSFWAYTLNITALIVCGVFAPHTTGEQRVVIIVTIVVFVLLLILSLFASWYYHPVGMAMRDMRSQLRWGRRELKRVYRQAQFDENVRRIMNNKPRIK